jgi:hypothetical protein
MKILPILFEQNVNTVNLKLDYYTKKQEKIMEETSQDVLAFSIFFVYPNFSNLFNIPTTISPLSVFSESYGLLTSKLNIYINYLATKEDLMDNVARGNKYDFVPATWNIRIYLPIDIMQHFLDSLGKVFKVGALVFLSELKQETIDGLKKSGCKNISLLGRHIMHQKDVDNLEISTIIDIITTNQDCEFIINTEIQEIIDKIKDLPNVQICINQGYWADKIEN